MADNEMLDYVRGLIRYDNTLLEGLDTEAEKRDDIQPFIEPELAKLLGVLIRTSGAREILEIGSGIGYSTIWLASSAAKIGGKVTAVDNHPRTIKEAAKNIEASGLEDHIDLRFGDAQVILPEMAAAGRQFDLIFQDCGKYVYELVYEDVYRLLRPGGLLFTDDTLLQFDPQVRAGLGRHVAKYNSRLFADLRYYSTILPVGQGICLSIKEGCL